jgi:hypothetical protein
MNFLMKLQKHGWLHGMQAPHKISRARNAIIFLMIECRLSHQHIGVKHAMAGGSEGKPINQCAGVSQFSLCEC